MRLDMPARSSPRHFNEMMQRLEAIEPGGETDIAETLHQLANRLQTPRPDRAGERSLRRAGGGRPGVAPFPPPPARGDRLPRARQAEIEFPFRDVIAFHDLETGERIQVDPAYVRDEYVAEVEAFIDDYRRACAEAQIDYVLADTSTPYDFMLSKYLAKRSRP